MNFATFLAALVGFFKFFNEVSSLIKLLQKTPQEKHDALMKRVNDVFDEKLNGGRPRDF